MKAAIAQNQRRIDRFLDSLGRPPRMGKRGPRRSNHRVDECANYDSFRLNRFLIQRTTPSTLLEFDGLHHGVRVDRLDAGTIKFVGLPGVQTEQDVEFEILHGTVGSRSYFLCPQCGARRRFLYIPLGLSGLRCRVCWGLRYPPRKPHLDRLLAQHALQGEALAAVVQLRATRMIHGVAPADETEIELRMQSLLDRCEDLSKRLAQELPPRCASGSVRDVVGGSSTAKVNGTAGRSPKYTSRREGGGLSHSKESVAATSAM